MALLILSVIVGCATFSGPTIVKRGVVFKSIPGAKDLKGDFYFPKSRGPHPAVVVVHGGGWIRRSGVMEGICKKLARNGFVAFNVTYRLAPESHFPKPVEDVRDAIAFLKKHAAEYDVDPLDISGWGYSAGSNILLLAALDGTAGLHKIVAGGTPSDLTLWPKSTLVKEYIGESFADRPDLWKAASPVNYVTIRSPPVFLYHGAWDDLVEIDQMWRLQKALEFKKIPVETYVAEYLGHFGTYLFNSTSESRAIAFLKQTK